MRNLSIIAAIGLNNELGIDNHLIWKIKEDLAFYKAMTENKFIIMGRKTFESMPASALVGRRPIVISSKPLDRYCNVDSFGSTESVLNFVNLIDEEFMVVGGASIYESFLPYVDRMYLTEIYDEHLADSYFPYFDTSCWERKILASNDCETPYEISRYTRRRSKNEKR